MFSTQQVRAIIFTCLVSALSFIAKGEDTAAPSAPDIDKSAYTLFNPTPRAEMRDFITDRPNVTEGPFTVDAGHLQIESSFVEYTHDQAHGVRSDGFSILPTNFRLGLLNNVDLQLIVNPHDNIHTHGHGTSQRNDGFGDTQIRSTINLWGNDGGKTAFGLIPFLTLPTGTDGLSDHHVEGGLILPLDITLPYGFDLATEVEVDVNHNDKKDNYGVDLVHTVSLGHALFNEKLNGYIEYAGVSPCGTGHAYLAYFNTGVTYALTDNIQLDTGINVGLSGKADDFTVFTGISLRF